MIEALPEEVYKDVTKAQDDRAVGRRMGGYWRRVLGRFDSDPIVMNDFGDSKTYGQELARAKREGVEKMVEFILEERKG